MQNAGSLSRQDTLTKKVYGMLYELQIYSRFQAIPRLVESTDKGANSRSKYVTQVQHESKYVTQVHLSSSRLVEFIYLVFTRMPCESYRR